MEESYVDALTKRMYYIYVLTGLAVLLVAGYYYLTSTFDFWTSRGISGPKPLLLFGNLKDVIFAKRSLNDLLTEDYFKFDGPMWGIYDCCEPVLVLKDPEYIKDVLIKDFAVFADRGVRLHEKVDPMGANLLNLEPERWRPLRIKLSSAFTSGKLKNAFFLLMECADKFEQLLSKKVEENSIVECRELTAKFTIDAIGSCVFGLELNAMSEDDSQFLKLGQYIFTTSGGRWFKLRLKETIPWLYELLWPIMYDSEMNNFFIDLMAQTIDYRKKKGVKRNDLVDLLIEIKENPSKTGGLVMTDELMAAQVFIFFTAGFETSSATICNALYELALNHSIQSKLRQEINEEIGKNYGKLSYDGIKAMNYLHKVFLETLRKYPPLPVIPRKSTAPYTFVGSKVSIPEKTQILIPVFAIQRDPTIYPDPDSFDPERFNPDRVNVRHSSFFLPFGNGPRNCIGERLGHYQSKVGIVKVIKNYKIDICNETTIPYKFHQKAVLLVPIDGIKLKLTKIK